MTTTGQYKSTFRLFASYWGAYGGLRAFLRSPYLHIAILLNLVMHENWFGSWWEIPISVLPNLIGFTLGGYAILLAFGDEEFRSLFAGGVTAQRSSPS